LCIIVIITVNIANDALALLHGSLIVSFVYMLARAAYLIVLIIVVLILVRILSLRW
jgi:hypothetical protein